MKQKLYTVAKTSKTIATIQVPSKSHRANTKNQQEQQKVKEKTGHSPFFYRTCQEGNRPWKVTKFHIRYHRQKKSILRKQD